MILARSEEIFHKKCPQRPSNASKSFNNIQVWSESTSNGLKISNDFFKDIKAFNSTNNSGANKLINGDSYNVIPNEDEVVFRYINNKYNVSIPRNMVVNNLIDNNNLNNLYYPVGNYMPSSRSDYDRGRIKGDYSEIKLTYDNTINYNFVLKYIVTIFNLNQR